MEEKHPTEIDLTSHWKTDLSALVEFQDSKLGRNGQIQSM